MADYLVIRLGTSPETLAHWIAVDSSGARLGPPVAGPISEAVNDVMDRDVIVLVPSAEVLTTSVDIPVKGAKLQAALPYALEEYLAEDVDNLHFAAGPKRSSGRTPVSVVSNERIDEWLAVLAAADIYPDQLVAESYGLARIPGTISMLLADEFVIINDGDDIELVMQAVSPGDALAAIGALDDGTAQANTDNDSKDDSDVSTLPRHVLVYCEPGVDEKYQHDWIAIRHELDSVDIKLLSDGITPRLAATVATGAGINLLQGRYGAKKEYSGLLRPWKHAAMLLLAFGIIGIVGKAVGYYDLTRQEAELQRVFNEEYKEMVPGASDTNTPAAVVDSLRRRVGVTDSTPLFLQSMEQLSKAFQANSSARIEAISFRADVIDLRVSAPDVATLDGIQRAIGESGAFRANIQSTDQDGEMVSSRMQIQAQGS